MSGTLLEVVEGAKLPYTITASNGVPPDDARAFAIVYNRKPIVGAPTFTTFRNTPAQRPLDLLLQGASDPDGDNLFPFLPSSSTQGGAVSYGSAKDFSYVPPPEFSGTDSIEIEISDGRGGISSASVVVDVRDPDIVTLTIASFVLDTNSVTVLARGLPGSIYRIRSTTDLHLPFSDLSGDLMADKQGNFEFVDQLGPKAPAQRFYRAEEILP